MLRLVLPKGSLERATLDLFDAADLPVLRSAAVQYLAQINDPRITDVRILRPQEIPTYLAEGLFDLGITGRDWIEETESDVVSLGELRYSKATNRPIRLVIAVACTAVKGFFSPDPRVRDRNATFALMSGNTRESLSTKRTLTRSVPLDRSSVGTMRLTTPAKRRSGNASSWISHG